MGKDMDGTEKKTDRKPKTKKAGTAGSGSTRLSVVSGGKENKAADALSPEKTSAAAKEKSSQRASVRKNSAKHISGEKQESSAGKKTSVSEVPAEKNAKKDTEKRADIKKEDNTKKGTGAGTKEGTKEGVKGGTKEEKTENKKENKKEVKKETKAEAKRTAKKTAKKKLKKGAEGTAIPQDMPKKDTSKKNVSKKNASGKNASKKNMPEPNASERMPAAQQKDETGKKAETKKTAGKSAAQTVPKASGKAVSKAVPKRKGGSGVKSRNPNLKLIKNEEFETAKARRPKKELGRKTYEEKSYQDYDEKMYRGGNGIVEWFFQHKSLFIIGLMAFSVVAALAWGYYYIVTNYKVTTVYVDGNVHYSNEEIMDMVMTGAYGNNSLYLAMKYKDKGVEGVPFVEKMDVSILTPDTIRINVYEKALAGYVEYLGRYMYFDREGIVVESSQEKTESIPQVTGLKFGYVVLNEALPVENDSIFKRILSITQLLDKYELMADRIYFNSDYDLTLYFDDVRVTLGSSEDIDEKVMRLQYILPELTGKSGTLSMENYTEDTKSIPFLQD